MFRILIPIASLSLGACLMTGLGGSSAIKADNPLDAEPLMATSRSDVFAQSEKDCSFWPLENEIEISATETKLCVRMKVLKESPTPSWSGPPPMNRTEFVRISTDSKEARPSMQVEKKREAKIGTCRGKSVWSFEYKGCEPNDGTLTADTSWLSADNKRWTFKEEASAEPAPAAN